MKNKKIVFHVTKQYMKNNKGRTITTFIGIVFMVVLMTCVFIGKDTVLNFLTKTGEADKGKWHANIYNVTKEEYDEISGFDFVAETAISRILGFSDININGKKIIAKEEKPFIYVKGYSEKDFDWMNITLAEGRFPENENEVVLSESILKDGVDVKVGDSISCEYFTRQITGIKPNGNTFFPFSNVSVSFGETTEVPQDFPYFGENDSFEESHTMTGEVGSYKVVGFVKETSFEGGAESFYPAIALIPNTYPVTGDNIRESDDQTKVNLSLKFDLRKNAFNDSCYPVIYRAIGDRYSDVEVNSMVLIFSGNSSEDSFNILINAFVCFFVILTVFISVILIYNVFNISYDERRKYLGMLSSVGATRSQKRSSIYYEAYMLLIAALPVGFGMGLLIVQAGMLAIKPYLMKIVAVELIANLVEVPVTLMIKPVAVLLIMIVSIVTVFISAYLPALKIGKIGPIESIKGTEEKAVKKFKTNKKAFLSGNASLLLATNQLKLNKQKTRSIVRAMAAFVVILVVTTYGAKSIIKVINYKLVDGVSVSANPYECDFMVNDNSAYADYAENENYVNLYEEMKKEILANENVEYAREAYMDMLTINCDKEVISEEYWQSLKHIADLYYPKEMSEEDFYQLMGEEARLGIWSVDEELFAKIAKKCGADMSIATDMAENPVIFYKNTELSTDNWRFNESNPRDFYYRELDNTTDLKIGDKFDGWLNYVMKQESTATFTVCGYAGKEDIKDYVSFGGEQLWIITCNDVVRNLNQTVDEINSLNEEAYAYKIPACLYVKVNDRESDIAKQLLELSMKKDDEQGVIVWCSYSGEDAFAENMLDIAGAMNKLIRIIAVCFIIFSSFVCLLNMFNAIRARRDSRKKEIAMLRSVGMVQKQLDKMLIHENIRIGAKSIAWAVLITIPLNYAVSFLINNFFGHMALPLPTSAYIFGILVAIISIFVITKICYNNDSNDNIIELMRRETV